MFNLANVKIFRPTSFIAFFSIYEKTFPSAVYMEICLEKIKGKWKIIKKKPNLVVLQILIKTRKNLPRVLTIILQEGKYIVHRNSAVINSTRLYIYT